MATHSSLQYSCCSLGSSFVVRVPRPTSGGHSPSLPQLLRQFHPKRLSSLSFFLSSTTYHVDPHCFICRLNQYDVQMSISSLHLSSTDNTLFCCASHVDARSSISHVECSRLNLSFCLPYLSHRWGLDEILRTCTLENSNWRQFSTALLVNHSYYSSCLSPQ